MNMVKESNIVVTGASGFIGAHLVATLLKGGYKAVTAVMSSERSLDKLTAILNLYNLPLNNESLTFRYIDLCYYKDTEEMFKGKDIVFHAAAKVDFAAGENLIYDNVLMTECVVAAAQKSKVKRFIHVSSIATLEPPLYPKVCNENMTISSSAHKSHYAISKFYCENIVLRAAEEGLNISIVLPSVVVGRGATSTGSASLLDIYSNTFGFYSRGVMGYVYVKDVARAMIAVATNSQAIGERYILSSENISYKDLFTLCAAAKHKRAPGYKVGKITISLASFIISILTKLNVKLPINSSTPQILDNKALYDGSKIVDHLGFSYTPISDAVTATLED